MKRLLGLVFLSIFVSVAATMLAAWATTHFRSDRDEASSTGLDGSDPEAAVAG